MAARSGRASRAGTPDQARQPRGDSAGRPQKPQLDHRMPLIGKLSHHNTRKRKPTNMTNPIIACTTEELAFAAWQAANDRDDLSRSGLAWEAFSGWWNTREWSVFGDGYRMLCFAAWNASHDIMELTKMSDYDSERFTRWWQSVMDGSPTISKA